ncbi:hypothetical protein BAE44_0019249, partial [Dichanthelium oligosanthes]
LTYYIDRVA